MTNNLCKIARTLFVATFLMACGASSLPSSTDIQETTVPTSAPLNTPLAGQPPIIEKTVTSVSTIAPPVPNSTEMPTSARDISPTTVTGLQLIIASVPLTLPDYDRGEWRSWFDADGDCQDTRQEVLIEESNIPVTFESSNQCRVASGDWTGPYTNTAVDNPSDLDIDHMVPLANAHRSGGWTWSKEQKASFANDISYSGHLIATTASANRSKGSRGPEEWRPPDETYWCTYAVDWISIKGRWELTATDGEWNALRDMLDTCD